MEFNLIVQMVTKAFALFVFMSAFACMMGGSVIGSGQEARETREIGNFTQQVFNGDAISRNVNYLDEFSTMYHQNSIDIKSMPRKHIETFFTILCENLFVFYAYVNSGELGRSRIICC